MEQEQDTPWTQLTGHINTQKRENGQQTQRLEHPNLTQLMDHCLKTMSQVDMHKRTVSLKQWLSLKSPTQGSLKTHVLKRWKLFNKQEWTN
ncbi:PB1-F2 protein [Influenza A virus (A/American green-winged teal/Interior Alaska/9BM5277R0/2009(H4N6))]|uniref:Protein PB1-F2 n=17 Tax=Influenza A virus TaxID=11320 RepID=E6XXT0_9INFA|nr:PB1-F2 protein [Influenza A virus (A/mallard/Interior Alaska/8BM3627R1/2008(H4N6))]ADU53097.2 PB1-F2 protein [Influenza A virus (A/northern pintail/Interior Alaska/8BM3608/2008(H4N6))]ADU56813.2 PB1-F2 protein [Influenza A virus (A/northern pintail/Interior Alaska/8BM3431R1/2008(N6))]AGG25357.1 PB1-F2 protein [Influenza A virus (A/American green-winged teal/Interior Alaska/9BM5277R0/2009(H4N6))]AGG25429.1 PB1-F2 protein [Influenza A virus (A/mallard/Interior Alaska/10BM04618R0/2010(H4N6))]A